MARITGALRLFGILSALVFMFAALSTAAPQFVRPNNAAISVVGIQSPWDSRESQESLEDLRGQQLLILGQTGINRPVGLGGAGAGAGAGAGSVGFGGAAGHGLNQHGASSAAAAAAAAGAQHFG